MNTPRKIIGLILSEDPLCYLQTFSTLPQYSARTECGYATVKDVRDHTLEDRMESFFLAETTKYVLQGWAE